MNRNIIYDKCDWLAIGHRVCLDDVLQMERRDGRFDEWACLMAQLDVCCRFCKPLDSELLKRLAKEHPIMISVEEGAIGGFASHGEQLPCSYYATRLQTCINMHRVHL